MSPGRVVVALATALAVTGPGAAASATTAARSTTPATAEAVVSPDLVASLARTAPSASVAVIVRLRARADLSGLPPDRRLRLREILTRLRRTSQEASPEVRRELGALVAEGQAPPSAPKLLWIDNAVALSTTAAGIRRLAALPSVAAVTADPVIPAPSAVAGSRPEPNLTQIRAPAVWATGALGEGVVVADMDTGVDISHPDLAARWRGGSNSWYDATGQYATPTDRSGHGTWTTSVLVAGAAGGSQVGVAPQARFIAARIFDDAGRATTSGIHAAFQWLLDPDGDPATADAPDLVNASWSQGVACSTEFEPDLQSLRSAGILPVFAAGNYGPNAATDTSPANLPEALSVGGVDGADLADPSSSRGPTACAGRARVFPDVVAPDVGIRVADLFGGYATVSGTSLAAPHVTGALALLLSARRTDPAAAQAALMAGAVDLGASGWDDTYGAGRVDVAAALAALPLDPAGFSDGFESGTTGAWDRVVGARGLTVTRGAAVTGAFGLRVRTGQRPAYVVDELAAPTSTYRATWRMRMDGLRSEGAAVPVLWVVDASGRRLLEVSVRTVRGACFVRLGTAGGYTPWRPLPAAAPGLELSTGAGGATLAVDGVVVATGQPLAAPASAVRLGAVTGTDAYGPIAFDDVVSTPGAARP